MTKHKHTLKVLDNDESFLDDPIIRGQLAFFRCTQCGRHFYILKEDMRRQLTGDIRKPFRPNRGMFMRDPDGELHLIYTVVS